MEGSRSVRSVLVVKVAVCGVKFSSERVVKVVLHRVKCV